MNALGIVCIGLIIGVLTSYSGVGAGALLTPLLVLALGVRSDIAIGSDLLFALVTKVFALTAHARVRTLDRQLLWAIAPGGIFGAVAGVAVTAMLHVRISDGQLDHVLRMLLGIALLVSATAVFFGRHKVKAAEEAGGDAPLPFVPLALIGAFVGFLVSLTSVGAGSLTLPLLLMVIPNTPLRRLVGSDIAFSVILLVPSLIGHVAIGDVDVRLAGLLLLGSIPGVFLGALLVRGIPERAFRAGLALVLTGVGVTMLR